MTSAGKALRGAGQRQEGRQGLAQARSHPATQVQMPILPPRSRCRTWPWWLHPVDNSASPVSWKEPRGPSTLPAGTGPNPSTAGAIQSNRNNTTPGWRHPTLPGPSLCIPADTPGGRPETRMHWEGGCLQLSSVLTLCMFEHSTTGVLKEQLSPLGSERILASSSAGEMWAPGSRQGPPGDLWPLSLSPSAVPCGHGAWQQPGMCTLGWGSGKEGQRIRPQLL